MNTIALSKINLEAPTQLRALGEDMTHIKDLAYSFADTGSFKELPWVGLVIETGEYVPIDGFHRLNAIDWLSKQNEIPVTVDVENVAIRYSEFETMAEAIVAAAGVNANHGLKRKKGDIQNTIRKLLEVDRIRFMETPYKLKKKALMEVVACSDRMYRQESQSLREDLEIARNREIKRLSNELGLSQREIAERVDCSQRTVSNILGEQKRHDAKNAQDENAQIDGEQKRHDAKIAQGDNDQIDGEQKWHDAKNAQDENEQEESPSVFTHITEAQVVSNPWDDAEEALEVQEEATGPSFSGTEVEQKRHDPLTDTHLIGILSNLSGAQKALALEYLSNDKS
jgi:DNA-binding transcriptional regulator YiaG